MENERLWFDLEALLDDEVYCDRVVAPLLDSLNAFLDSLDSVFAIAGFEVPQYTLGSDSIVTTVSSVDNHCNSGLEFPTTAAAMPSTQSESSSVQESSSGDEDDGFDLHFD